MKTYLIAGGSRGLGAALSEGIPRRGDRVLVLSRTKPNLTLPKTVDAEWIPIDLAEPNIQSLVDGLNGTSIDALIFVAGIWESEPFLTVPASELERILRVNLSSFLLLTQALAPNLMSSGSSKVIAIGSTSGLENEGSTSVAYAASKFGLRGAVHSLREVFRPLGIPITCISPGSLATDVPLRNGQRAAEKKHCGNRIPVGDIVKLVRCILSLSRVSCVKEIHVPAINDTDA